MVFNPDKAGMSFVKIFSVILLVIGILLVLLNIL